MKKTKKIFVATILATVALQGVTNVELTNSQVAKAEEVQQGTWIKSSDGRWWYQYQNGSYPTGWAKISNTWYYFDSSGWMQTGWVKPSDGKWYYLNSSGAMLTGWQKISNVWYYLNTNGDMATNAWVDNNKYYVGANGAWIPGVNNGWMKEGGSWYYYKNGELVKNAWQGAYYLKADGKMAASEWIYDNYYQSWYYLKADGSYARNMWAGNYWLNDNGKMAKNAWVDNNKYYVGGDGAWVPSVNNGWMKEGGSWYYYKNGEAVKNVWQGAYYLKADGKMAASEWIYDKDYNSWYYLEKEGYYNSQKTVRAYNKLSTAEIAKFDNLISSRNAGAIYDTKVELTLTKDEQVTSVDSYVANLDGKETKLYRRYHIKMPSIADGRVPQERTIYINVATGEVEKTDQSK